MFQLRAPLKLFNASFNVLGVSWVLTELGWLAALLHGLFEGRSLTDRCQQQHWRTWRRLDCINSGFPCSHSVQFMLFPPNMATEVHTILFRSPEILAKPFLSWKNSGKIGLRHILGSWIWLWTQLSPENSGCAALYFVGFDCLEL